VISEGRIVSLRPEDAGNGVRRIDLDGRAIYPAFADCHVHLTDTGLFLGERDLSGVRDAASFAQRIAALANGAFVLAGKYDESRWADHGVATASPLDASFPDAIAMAVRVDGHSCLLNRKALAFADLPYGTAGI
jgi:predicted amidohydrolase YtcJ